MVYLYYCKACEDGRHGDCELGHPAPPGVYGGSKCRCQCSGDPLWNTPEKIARDLRELTERIIHHQEISKKANLVVGKPKV